MATPGLNEPADLDRAFEEHRAAVLAMLRAKYRDVPDHEDLYQEAWLEALEKAKGGVPIANLRALLKLIADRRARDRLRDFSPIPADPTGAFFAAQIDRGRLPDDLTQVSIDGAIVRNVVDELEPRRAAAIKMRFELGMTSSEIEDALGINRRRLDKLFRTTYRAIEEQLTADGSGETPWTRRQRSILHAWLSGWATPAQEERARHLVQTDPSCRAMFVELRATLDRVAAVLPMPLVTQGEIDRAVPVLDQLNQTGVALRDALVGGAGKASTHAPVIEPATGGLASITAAGAAKVVLVCLSLGGGAAVCVEVAVLGKDPKPEKALAYEKASPPAKNEQVAKVRPRPTPTPRPVVRAKPKQAVAKPKAAAVVRPKTNGPVAASPVPPGSTEFGPGSIGSVAASNEPAAAPADGGGEFTP